MLSKFKNGVTIKLFCQDNGQFWIYKFISCLEHYKLINYHFVPNFLHNRGGLGVGDNGYMLALPLYETHLDAVRGLI